MRISLLPATSAIPLILEYRIYSKINGNTSHTNIDSLCKILENPYKFEKKISIHPAPPQLDIPQARFLVLIAHPFTLEAIRPTTHCGSPYLWP